MRQTIVTSIIYLLPRLHEAKMIRMVIWYIHCSIQQKCITLLFIVQSLLHYNPPNIWIEIIQIVNQIKCLPGTKCLYPDCDLDCDLYNFAPCKRLITNLSVEVRSKPDAGPYFIVLVAQTRRAHRVHVLLEV